MSSFKQIHLFVLLFNVTSMPPKSISIPVLIRILSHLYGLWQPCLQRWIFFFSHASHTEDILQWIP